MILEIEMQGALKVKERCPEALLIFVTPPTAEELSAGSAAEAPRRMKRSPPDWPGRLRKSAIWISTTILS